MKRVKKNKLILRSLENLQYQKLQQKRKKKTYLALNKQKIMKIFCKIFLKNLIKVLFKINPELILLFAI